MNGDEIRTILFRLAKQRERVFLGYMKESINLAGELKKRALEAKEKLTGPNAADAQRELDEISLEAGEVLREEAQEEFKGSKERAEIRESAEVKKWDTVYGDVRTELEYPKEFDFETVADLEQVMSSVVFIPIEKTSGEKVFGKSTRSVFERKYTKVPGDGVRMEKETNTGAFILNCEIPLVYGNVAGYDALYAVKKGEGGKWSARCIDIIKYDNKLQGGNRIGSGRILLDGIKNGELEYSSSQNDQQPTTYKIKI